MGSNKRRALRRMESRRLAAAELGLNSDEEEEEVAAALGGIEQIEEARAVGMPGPSSTPHAINKENAMLDGAAHAPHGHFEQQPGSSSLAHAGQQQQEQRKRKAPSGPMSLCSDTFTHRIGQQAKQEWTREQRQVLVCSTSPCPPCADILQDRLAPRDGRCEG